MACSGCGKRRTKYTKPQIKEQQKTEISLPVSESPNITESNISFPVDDTEHIEQINTDTISNGVRIFSKVRRKIKRKAIAVTRKQRNFRALANTKGL